MRSPNPTAVRRAALLIEAAIVYPVTIALLLMIVVGGVGVFRYQQVAGHAREAARWASVRGSDYRRSTGHASPTAQQIFDDCLVPLAAGLDTRQLSLDVQWIDASTGAAVDWNAASRDPKQLTSTNGYLNNRVRVTVTYRWSPGLFIGTLNLTSTSEMPMSF